MNHKKYLIFHKHNLHYGIQAAQVQEIFPLPELIPVTGENPDIIGILNLRMQIVPVMHLDWLQGYSPQACHLDDYIIVVQCEGLQIGILVHNINEMLELDDKVIKTESTYGFFCDIDTAFIAGIAKVESKTIFLLDIKKLVRQPDTLFTLIWDAQSQLDLMTVSDNGQQQDEEFQTPNFYDLYCPHTTPEERVVFRQRAVHLRQSIESLKDSEETNKLVPLAVIEIDNNYYGLDLELVCQFTDIDNLTPIPCCPQYIVGNMNLRGEIVTLVDIRNVLNLPITPIRVGSKAVVVQVDDIIVGLPVNQVLEVVYLNPTEMTLLPALELLNDAQYLRGMAFFREKKLSILDLPKILTQGGLIV
ncbi:MAG: chemotaxis protein CheW, partial [Scytonema sp. CRU_2_7]|nr:chemotaxis protein CheW [Scytonema sp. CRU_2_7]